MKKVWTTNHQHTMNLLLFEPEAVNNDNEENNTDLGTRQETHQIGLNNSDSEMVLSEEVHESTEYESLISNPTPSTSAAASGLQLDGGHRFPKLPKKKLPFMKKTKILDTPNFSLYIERTDFQNYNPLT